MHSINFFVSICICKDDPLQSVQINLYNQQLEMFEIQKEFMAKQTEFMDKQMALLEQHTAMMKAICDYMLKLTEK